MQRLSLQTSILATLAYSDLFQTPLTVSQLCERLISHNATESQIKSTLKKMSRIEVCEGMVVLAGRSNILKIHQQRQAWSKEKWQEVQLIQKLLRSISTVSAAYITGALAVDNVGSQHDDIDLMIVCRPNSLWVTRLWMIIKSGLLGKYRTHTSAGDNKWCFNLWVESTQLMIPQHERSLYVAYEILQARSILGEQDTLITSNSWINEYINYSKKEVESTNDSRHNIPEVERSQFNTLLNELAYRLQRHYMKPHRTIEKVSKRAAFFHPRDTKNIIRDRWLTSLKRLGVKKEEMAILQEMM